MDDPLTTPALFARRSVPLVIKLLGFFAGVTLAVCVYVFYGYSQSFRDVLRPVRAMIVRLLAPEEVRAMRVLAYTDDTTQYIDPYSGVVLGSVDGTVISEDTRGALNVRVISWRDGYTVKGSEGFVYATSSTPIVGVAVSPSGGYVAFARSIKHDFTLPSVAFLPIVQSDPDSWETVVVRVQDGTTVLTVRGALPFFLDEGTVGYVDSTGIKSMGLDRKIEHVLVQKRLLRTQLLSLISPDHLHVAIQDRSVGYTHVYRIEPVTRTLAIVSAFKTPRAVASFALGNSSLLGVEVVDSKLEVWSRPYTGGAEKTVAVVVPALRAKRIDLGTY